MKLSTSSILVSVEKATNGTGGVLAVWGFWNNPTYGSLAGFDGSNNHLQWTYDANATAFGMCSITFEDEIYFIGQVSSKKSLVFLENI